MRGNRAPAWPVAVVDRHERNSASLGDGLGRAGRVVAARIAQTARHSRRHSKCPSLDFRHCSVAILLFVTGISSRFIRTIIKLANLHGRGVQVMNEFLDFLLGVERVGNDVCAHVREQLRARPLARIRGAAGRRKWLSSRRPKWCSTCRKYIYEGLPTPNHDEINLR